LYIAFLGVGLVLYLRVGLLIFFLRLGRWPASVGRLRLDIILRLI